MDSNIPALFFAPDASAVWGSSTSIPTTKAKQKTITNTKNKQQQKSQQNKNNEEKKYLKKMKLRCRVSKSLAKKGPKVLHN